MSPTVERMILEVARGFVDFSASTGATFVGLFDWYVGDVAECLELGTL
jgi:hypothetical protein